MDLIVLKTQIIGYINNQCMLVLFFLFKVIHTSNTFKLGYIYRRRVQ